MELELWQIKENVEFYVYKKQKPLADTDCGLIILA